mmetsp:Transcript_8752/g.17172  ORF Transcript_8752/g.17172 Transcript_8752/m.17172 type:complete len:283 (+) Transcript_8752:226-1074(+)
MRMRPCCAKVTAASTDSRSGKYTCAQGCLAFRYTRTVGPTGRNAVAIRIQSASEGIFVTCTLRANWSALERPTAAVFFASPLVGDFFCPFFFCGCFCSCFFTEFGRNGCAVARRWFWAGTGEAARGLKAAAVGLRTLRRLGFSAVESMGEGTSDILASGLRSSSIGDGPETTAGSTFRFVFFLDAGPSGDLASLTSEVICERSCFGRVDKPGIAFRMCLSFRRMPFEPKSFAEIADSSTIMSSSFVVDWKNTSTRRPGSSLFLGRHSRALNTLPVKLSPSPS